jgi:hypothetical protein
MKADSSVEFCNSTISRKTLFHAADAKDGQILELGHSDREFGPDLGAACFTRDTPEARRV